MPATLVWNILLVEDNQGDANLISTCVNDHAGLGLFHAPNALQANRFLHRISPFEDVAVPDLVLLDLGLPILNGFEVLQGMRESPGLAQVPVIVLTSSTYHSDRERALALGASEHLVKPVEWGHWQRTMTRIFRRYLKGFPD